MYIQLEYSGEWLEPNNTDEKKWRGSISLPWPPLPTPAPLAVFSRLIFLCACPESRGLRSRQIHFVMRARNSRDYGRKTTRSKNDLHGVEHTYIHTLLLPPQRGLYFPFVQILSEF